MKAIFAAAMTLALSVPAASANSTVPLDAGKPAGIRQAQLEGDRGILVVAGAALVGISIGLAVSGDSGSQPGTTTTSSATTSTTSTTP